MHDTDRSTAAALDARAELQELDGELTQSCIVGEDWPGPRLPRDDPGRQQAAARLALGHARRCGKVLTELPAAAASPDFTAARLALAALLSELEDLAGPTEEPTPEETRTDG